MCPHSRVKKGVSPPKRHRFMKKDRFKKDQMGVAAVIGRIRIAPCFLTLLTVLVTTWIPVTMKDNERNHMNDVISQFSDMKGSVDNMMVYTTISGKPSLPTYQAVTLGNFWGACFRFADGGLPFGEPEGVEQFHDNHLLHPGHWVPGDVNGGGRFRCTPRTAITSNSGWRMRTVGCWSSRTTRSVSGALPSITFTNDSGALNLDWSQIDLIGANSSVGGTGIEGLNLGLFRCGRTDLHPSSQARRGHGLPDQLWEGLLRIPELYNGIIFRHLVRCSIRSPKGITIRTGRRTWGRATSCGASITRTKARESSRSHFRSVYLHWVGRSL